MESEKAKWAITKFVGGRRTATYRLRDWLISRQRYWGSPIPMIYCEACAKAGRGERKEMPGWFAVPEKDLPVKLPYVKNFRPTGTDKSPLATVEKFWKIRCPKCKSWARRETDVSDTFLDSAWYYLGYLTLGNQKSKIKNKKFALDRALVERWLPVDMYIGGAEHAVLHLLYSRFLAMAFHDWGLLHFEEPFTVFRAHGLVLYQGGKMSKSKGNVVSPDPYVRAYGMDALRLYLAFLAPFSETGDFRDTGMRGVTRFLERVWRLVTERKAQSAKRKAPDATAERLVHKTIKKVTADIEGLQYNTAISALMVLLNAFAAKPDAVGREHISIFLRLLAPFAPHITEELWSRFFAGKKSPALGRAEAMPGGIRDSRSESGHVRERYQSIHLARWPEANPRYLKAERVIVVVQVNGRVRDRVEVESGTTEEMARKLVLERPKVNEWLAGKPVKKFIYVPDRIVNIVV